MIALNQKENQLLADLIKKYKTYSKPTPAQKALIMLGELPQKTDDDIKKLQLMLKAEKKAIQLFNQQQKVRELLKAEKKKEDALFDRKKYVLGGALLNAIVKNANLKNLPAKEFLRELVTQNLITDRDKALFDEYLSNSQNPVSAPSPVPTPQSEPSKLQQFQNRQNQS